MQHIESIKATMMRSELSTRVLFKTHELYQNSHANSDSDRNEPKVVTNKTFTKDYRTCSIDSP